MNSDHKVTLIIPTYQHPENILRLLLYYSAHPITLVIADGSPQPMNIASSGELVKAKWFYFNIPGANTILDRLKVATNLVSTEYFAFLDDGDLIFGSGLDSGVRTLTHLKEESLYCGRVGAWKSRVKTSLGNDVNAFVNWGHWTQVYENTNSNVSERMTSMISGMRSANYYYTLMRRDRYLDCFREMLELSISNADAVELIWCGLLAGTSGLSIKNIPFWMRGDTPAVSHELYGKAAKRSEWVYPAFAEEIDGAIEYLYRHLNYSKEIYIDKRQIREYFDLHNSGLVKTSPVLNFVSTNMIQWWSTVLQRNLSEHEALDLQRAESILSLFPEYLRFSDAFSARL